MGRQEQFSYRAISQRFAMFTIIGILLFSGSHSKAQNKTYPFKRGEKLYYTMHYGWFKIGSGEIWIEPDYETHEGKQHYNIQCNIKTVSWFKVFSKLNIHMESLVQSENLQPYKSYRNLSDGKKIDIRYDNFDYTDSVRIDAYIEDIDTWRYHTFALGENPVRDVLSTYLWLRSRKDGDLSSTVSARTFFTNDLYEFEMRPGKKTTYKYMGFDVGAQEFELIFPEGEYFEKGKTGRVVVSDDANQLPLKFELDMTVGTFSFEIESIKYGIQ